MTISDSKIHGQHPHLVSANCSIIRWIALKRNVLDQPSKSTPRGSLTLCSGQIALNYPRPGKGSCDFQSARLICAFMIIAIKSIFSKNWMNKCNPDKPSDPYKACWQTRLLLWWWYILSASCWWWRLSWSRNSCPPEVWSLNYILSKIYLR